MNDTKLRNTEDCLIITRRQSSILVAIGIFVLFFIFMIGYFLGTKHATDEFVAQVRQETFADQIFASVHSLSQSIPQPVHISEHNDNKEPVQEPTVLAELTSLQDVLQKQYAAELIGFVTEKAAQQFIDRVAHNAHINLELRTRSHMRRGKTTPWYQVVTPHYATEKELNNAIAAITKTEKLHKINVVSC